MSECEFFAILDLQVPQDLLPDLERSPLGERLENVEDLVRVITRELALMAAGMKGCASRWDQAWRQVIVPEVAKGETAKIQALGPRLLRAFEERLAQLKEIQEWVRWLESSGKCALSHSKLLQTEIAGMEQLKASVFDRWHTTDDLEDLAARDYPLTTADLEKAGEVRVPPASYYAEDSKPF